MKRNIRDLPRFLTHNGIWVGPLAVIWVVLHSIPNARLAALPGPLNSLASAVIFLTATYNGIIAKATYIGLVNNLITPFLGEIKTMGGLTAIRARLSKYTQTIATIKRAYAGLGAGATRMLLISGGAGFMLANLLSRNNKIDKYLVCLMSAVALINAMSRGLGDPTVRVFRAFWRDALRISGKAGKGLAINQVFAALSGIAAGLAGSIVFAFVNITNSYYDPTGYIIGGACVIGGIALSFSGNADAGKQPHK